MAEIRQFVVHCHHTGESVHWDLMFEHNDALATWQVDRPPEEIAAVPLEILRIFDHPRRFLTYQGPLRSHPGSVQIHDRGTYNALSMTDNHWHIRIDGLYLKRTLHLYRKAASPSGTPSDIWTITSTRT